MRPVNVLVFPGGSEIGLEINNALKYAKDVKVFGGSSVKDHSEVVYKRLIQNIPNIQEPDFLARFNEILKKHEIDFVFPALDSVQFYLSQHESQIDATLLSSPFSTVNICRSKRKTYEYLMNEWFIPKIYDSEPLIENYPLFSKPAVGEGSKGTRIICNIHEYEAIDRNSNIICEYLPGKEYTIDCLTINGNLIYSNMRTRSRTKAGISVRSINMKPDSQIIQIAQILNSRFDFIGAWFFQVKEDSKKQYKLMEVSPRIAGTMAASRAEGVNLPLLTIYAFMEYQIEIINNDYPLILEKAFINRFELSYDFETVYIDYDDTIIIGESVNPLAMALIYQFINQNIRIILLTKHNGNLMDDLKKHGISPGIFSKIIVLNSEDEKASFIDSYKSIFIDDSFSERQKVKKEKDIPVFDVDAIESLLDWRM